MDQNSLSERASKTVAALRQIKVGTGSLVCFGCGHEDDCSIHGCAVMREAAELIETLQAELVGHAEQDANERLCLAMRAGARAILNNHRLDGTTYVLDPFGKNGGPREISYYDAAVLLLETAAGGGFLLMGKTEGGY